VTGIAYAMGQTGAEGAGGGLTAFMPLIIMFVIFYFLLIRPQQKKAKQQQEMIRNLKKGDKVITTGGILGLIVSIKEDVATVEIAEKIKIKVVRQNLNLAASPAAEKETK